MELKTVAAVCCWRRVCFSTHWHVSHFHRKYINAHVALRAIVWGKQKLDTVSKNIGLMRSAVTLQSISCLSSNLSSASNFGFCLLVLEIAVCLPWRQWLWTPSKCTEACYTRPWGPPQSTGISPTSLLASTGGIFPVGRVGDHDEPQHSLHVSFLEFLAVISFYFFLSPLKSVYLFLFSYFSPQAFLCAALQERSCIPCPFLLAWSALQQ